MSKLRQDADAIIQAAITAAQPDEAVRKALEGRDFGSGRVVLVAAGKGAWQMANAASRILGSRIDTGIVITKYDHSKGPIANFTIREAGHPIPDENSFTATQQALDLVSGLTAQDTVLFLLSGGGSALFEKPLIPAADLEELTHNLLVCGADIVEINTLRKRFSGVKGGRFAQLCAPAHVVSIVLSDILGDPLDMIASGPAYPDSSTCAQAKEIVQKYHLPMTDQMLTLLEQETPKALDNVETQITGSAGPRRPRHAGLEFGGHHRPRGRVGILRASGAQGEGFSRREGLFAHHEVDGFQGRGAARRDQHHEPHPRQVPARRHGYRGKHVRSAHQRHAQKRPSDHADHVEILSPAGI